VFPIFIVRAGIALLLRVTNRPCHWEVIALAGLRTCILLYSVPPTRCTRNGKEGQSDIQYHDSSHDWTPVPSPTEVHLVQSPLKEQICQWCF